MGDRTKNNNFILLKGGGGPIPIEVNMFGSQFYREIKWRFNGKQFFHFHLFSTGIILKDVWNIYWYDLPKTSELHETRYGDSSNIKVITLVKAVINSNGPKGVWYY